MPLTLRAAVALSAAGLVLSSGSSIEATATRGIASVRVRILRRKYLSPSPMGPRAYRGKTLAYGQHEDRTPTHGYEPTREAAMAAFAKSWRRE